MGIASLFKRLLRGTPVYAAARTLHRRLFQPERMRELERKKAFYRPLIPRGSLVFDVGANRGNRTEVFLALGALVVAVEPVPALAEALDDWFDDNRRFTLVQKAVGAAEGQATMFVADLDIISTMAPEWVEACKRQPHLSHAQWTPRTVEVTTLDRLIAQYGVPSFAKIDVEGFEVEVLKGLSRPIPALSFEYTPFRPEPALECLRLLRRLGEARFNTSSGESLALAHEHWLDYDGIERFCREQVPREPEFGDVYVVFEPRPATVPGMGPAAPARVVAPGAEMDSGLRTGG